MQQRGQEGQRRQKVKTRHRRRVPFWALGLSVAAGPGYDPARGRRDLPCNKSHIHLAAVRSRSVYLCRILSYGNNAGEFGDWWPAALRAPRLFRAHLNVAQENAHWRPFRKTLVTITAYFLSMQKPVSVFLFDAAGRLLSFQSPQIMTPRAPYDRWIQPAVAAVPTPIDNAINRGWVTGATF
jgi:hypothetical protein